MRSNAPAPVQTGRVFVSAEAYAGASRSVHLGKIVSLQRLDRVYEKPLTFQQSLGKPHALVFEVEETLRGERRKHLELVLSPQHTLYLDYLRDHAVKILLVGGPTQLDSFPRAEVALEVEGKRVESDEYFQLRLLDPVRVPKEGTDKEIASQLNISYDSGRMFTLQLDVIRGNREILKRVRGFAKKYPEMLATTRLYVPTGFGALCGSPNAFCSITLPLCPETRATLERLKAHPEWLLRRIKPRGQDTRAWVTEQVDRALDAFSVAGQP